MKKYQNMMEIMVEEKFETLKSSLGCCTCEQCHNDIIAYALNLLPTKYVATTEGRLYSKLYSLANQHTADIVSALTQGVNIVSGSPRHTQDDLDAIS